MKQNVNKIILVASIILFIFFSVFSQISLKGAGLHAANAEGLSAQYLLNPYMWLTLACSAISLFFWRLVLLRLPLSQAYSWTALIYVFVPPLAHVIWGESFSLRYIIAMGFIILGIIITTRYGHPNLS